MTISQLLLKVAGVLAVAAVPLSTGSAMATTITFDDLPVEGEFITNGYNGFDWNNFYVFGKGTTNPYYSGTGYQNGTVSQPNVAFNAFADPASILSLTPFTFNSAYLTSAFNDGNQIKITGLLGGIVKDTKTVTLNTVTPLLATFNFQNIDTLTFTSLNNRNQFVIDDFTYNASATAVPEPFTILGSAVALGAGVAMKRKQAKKAAKP